MTKTIKSKVEFPLLALRDVVVFPSMVIPLFVGRDKSIAALESAMQSAKQIVLVTQQDASIEDPQIEDLYEVGTLANVLQMLRLPDGTVKVLVEGEARVDIGAINETNDYFSATIKKIGKTIKVTSKIDNLMRSLVNSFEQYVKINTKIPPEITASIELIEDPSKLVDTIAAQVTLKLAEKQQLLEMDNVVERLEMIMTCIESEIELLEIEKKIRGRVKKQMEKSQREYYLNEQMKAIQKELEESEDGSSDLDELEEKIKNAQMSEEAEAKALAEFKKLKMMSPMSAEASVIRNYIEWLTNVPWSSYSEINKDLALSQAILDEDHYGLDEVKERIVEYLAVQKRTDKLRGPILCLVGPPGVGKTSLGKSLAKSTNREFIRMALGGVRDEAEIRGHRRTYIGAMPGKIIQSITKAKVNNPLFMLDEIDKMGNDFRGDPSSALLEVLDPEQNNAFGDHFLEVDYDLSNVMFVATANTLDIPAPLLDRMEVIRLSGYTEAEKLNIAQKYLLPKQIERHGLKPSEIKITPEVITDVIRYYSQEAGVRNLEKLLAKICRKVVKELLLNTKKRSVRIGKKNLSDYLGSRKVRFGLAEKKNQIGQVTGLAWTSVGGDLLTIESIVVPGKGKQQFTGKLGDVMKESIATAVSVVRSRIDQMEVDPLFYETNDIHIHVPEGATPKDGPSAGVAMCTALVSSLTKIPVKAGVAMTGEITLRGEVLPIGGLKEKLLAAHRGGIKIVIIPEENKNDLKEISADVIADLEIHPVRWIDEVLSLALAEEPCKKLKKKSTKAKKDNRIPNTKETKGNKAVTEVSRH